MKNLLIIALLVLISGCKTKYVYSSNLKKADLKEMDSLYLEGLKAIRHDALCRLNFKYAHELKKEIKQKQKNK